MGQWPHITVTTDGNKMRINVPLPGRKFQTGDNQLSTPHLLWEGRHPLPTPHRLATPPEPTIFCSFQQDIELMFQLSFILHISSCQNIASLLWTQRPSHIRIIFLWHIFLWQNDSLFESWHVTWAVNVESSRIIQWATKLLAAGIKFTIQ